MVRGRKPTGPKLVEGLDGSDYAKLRLRVILETIGGDRTIESACDELGIGVTAFYKLRNRTLEEAVAGLEPRPVGRPRTLGAEESSTLEALRSEIMQLHADVKNAQTREEIALILGMVPPKKR